MPPCHTGPYSESYRATREKVQHKLHNIPTIEALLAEKDPNALSPAALDVAKKLAADLVRRNPTTPDEMKAAMKAQMKQFKTDNKKSMLLAGYRALFAEGQLPSRSTFIEDFLISKSPRSQSGVLVVTVFTSAYPDVDGVVQRFSCKWNCYYCPNEPGQPRSYLLNEPGVRRANRLQFDPVAQFTDRVRALVNIGHPADKIELLVLGGTWESYPDSYRERFIRDLFYAANTFDVVEATRRSSSSSHHDDDTGAGSARGRRPPMSLLQEQLANECAPCCRIIGVTLETRPDTINSDMLVRLRQMGCTRVQLGVQHTNDDILLTVNRQATREDTVVAIRRLKDACFKVDIHIMPDLPGATPALDKAMFDDILDGTELHADQWKIYPCQTTPFTVIQQWFQEGKYQSYGMPQLIEVLKYAKRRVHPWIRLNRVIRDIPIEYVLHGVECANLRQLLQIQMEREGGPRCRCIRCREVKGGDAQLAEKVAKATLIERRFVSSGADEVFLSFETPDEATIFGFLRLRLPAVAAAAVVEPEGRPFPELIGCALIRELHVYGNLVESSKKQGTSGRDTQHQGFGTRLLQRAEAIASAEKGGYDAIAVIAGVGVRSYYAKRGYRMREEDRGAYMIKPLRGASGIAVRADGSNNSTNESDIFLEDARNGLVVYRQRVRDRERRSLWTFSSVVTLIFLALGYQWASEGWDVRQRPE